ncbi:BURP domain protein USPL1-like [Mercurialis annua]|uniref:BURP domain protein USPL1-like n=1 Tax=Mercurialis annua TaxID=3986 RepID=UPI00216053CC|nr:BURP domain protein USPL1-like [Mercurialis annua]
MKPTFAFTAMFLLIAFAFNVEATRELRQEEFSFEKFEPVPGNLLYGYQYRTVDGAKEKSSFDKFEPVPGNLLYGYQYRTTDGPKEKSSLENNVLRLRSMDADNNSSFIEFFTLNDLKLGNRLSIDLPPLNLSMFPRLLSKKQADLIPFSSKKLPYLLNFFSFSPQSPQGKAVQLALKHCEAEPITGETKFCATSFESMLDNVRSMLGSDTKFKAITSTHLTRSKTTLQKYTVIRPLEEIKTPKMIGCHPVSYPYTIFHCHSDVNTKGFKVSLSGENGDRIEAIVVCHMDTSEWSDDHRSFYQIGSKPGLTEVCHFFPSHHMLWIPTQLA